MFQDITRHLVSTEACPTREIGLRFKSSPAKERTPFLLHILLAIVGGRNTHERARDFEETQREGTAEN